MNDRLHRGLDDELAPDELSSSLAREVDDARALFDGVVRAVPARPLPDLGASVLARIDEFERARGPRLVPAEPAQTSRPARRGLAAWLWRPQHVAVRPAWALAAAALLAVGVSVGAPRVLQQRGEAAAEAAARGQVLVSFRLDAPAARAVRLAGDFSGWTPSYEMRRSDAGVWTIVVPLPPGVHEYAFVVDGERWVADPSAPPRPDGFGGTNSRVAVLRPDPRS